MGELSLEHGYPYRQKDKRGVTKAGDAGELFCQKDQPEPECGI